MAKLNPNPPPKTGHSPNRSVERMEKPFRGVVYSPSVKMVKRTYDHAFNKGIKGVRMADFAAMLRQFGRTPVFAAIETIADPDALIGTPD